MKSGRKYWLSILLGIVLASAGLYLFLPALISNNTMDLSRADEMPDFKQTNNAFAFPGKGLKYCAPVVVLDAFVYLQRHGYASLIASQGKESLAAQSVTRIAECMGTSDSTGTSTEQFLEGVQTYIKKFTPYRIASLRYAGWNRHQKEFDAKKQVPDLQWLKDGIKGDRAEWLNIGWYKFDPKNKDYIREDGHWVVLAGYGMNFSGAADEQTLIVKDPNPVAGNVSRKIFIELQALQEGSLKGPHEGLPRDASGYLFIKSQSDPMDTQKRIGIIDGAVVLELMPAFVKR